MRREGCASWGLQGGKGETLVWPQKTMGASPHSSCDRAHVTHMDTSAKAETSPTDQVASGPADWDTRQGPHAARQQVLPMAQRLLDLEAESVCGNAVKGVCLEYESGTGVAQPYPDPQGSETLHLHT